MVGQKHASLGYITPLFISDCILMVHPLLPITFTFAKWEVATTLL